MHRARLIAAFAVLVFIASACGDGLPPEFPAKDFSLKSPISGQELTLSSIKGKPVMLYWFASW